MRLTGAGISNTLNSAVVLLRSSTNFYQTSKKVAIQTILTQLWRCTFLYAEPPFSRENLGTVFNYPRLSINFWSRHPFQPQMTEGIVYGLEIICLKESQLLGSGSRNKFRRYKYQYL